LDWNQSTTKLTPKGKSFWTSTGLCSTVELCRDKYKIVSFVYKAS
jgi:hypothetical protein